MPRSSCSVSQLFSGVTNAWQSRITDHRKALTFFQQFQKLGHPRTNVVLMKGEFATAGLEIAQQLSAMACVFTCDGIDRR
jgi:hypothetical protein